MIIWSGWGILVIAFAVIGVLTAMAGAEAITNILHLAQPLDPAIVICTGLLLAAAQIFFFTTWREGSGEARAFIDQTTGQRIEVRPTAGSLFFIPMRYWTWITLALAGTNAVSAIYSRLV